MNLFTTRQLLGYTEQKVKFNALFLNLFFRRTMTFKTQEVMLDKIKGKTPIAAYVSPVVGGVVLHNRGGETRVIRPGYVKPKHEVTYDQVVERLPGEDPAKLNDQAYRRLRILTDNLKQEEHAIVQVEEMQAVNAVLYGKYTMEGEQFDTVEVDFGRSAANNIVQAAGKKWSEQDRDNFDPTYDIDLYCDQASGLINIAVMDGKVWRQLNSFKMFREKLDTRRGSASEMETAVKDLGLSCPLRDITAIWLFLFAKPRTLIRTVPKNAICRKGQWSWGIPRRKVFVATAPFRISRHWRKGLWKRFVIRSTGSLLAIRLMSTP